MHAHPPDTETLPTPLVLGRSRCVWEPPEGESVFCWCASDGPVWTFPMIPAAATAVGLGPGPLRRRLSAKVPRCVRGGLVGAREPDGGEPVEGAAAVVATLARSTGIPAPSEDMGDWMTSTCVDAPAARRFACNSATPAWMESRFSKILSGCRTQVCRVSPFPVVPERVKPPPPLKLPRVLLLPELAPGPPPLCELFPPRTEPHTGGGCSFRGVGDGEFPGDGTGDGDARGEMSGLPLMPAVDRRF